MSLIEVTQILVGIADLHDVIKVTQITRKYHLKKLYDEVYAIINWYSRNTIW